jgi:hypothetical protein
MRRLLPIAALLACLLAAAPARAARDLELAVQDDPVLLYHSYGPWALALQRAQDMGAKRIRVNLRWAYSMPAAQRTLERAPRAVSWDFDALQRLLDEAQQHGMRLQVTLTGPAPAFATATHRVGASRPSPRYYAAFVRAALSRFGASIDRWSIWNEPNWHSQLGPAKSAPSVYRALYRAGYAAIKAIAPADQVLIGELMPGASRQHSMPALRFLRGVACPTCGRLVADGFALHPYNFAAAPAKARNPNPDVVEMGTLGRLERQLDRLRASGALRTPSNAPMPIYLTEFGYHTAGPLAVTSSTHAKWLTQAWDIAKRDPRVRQLLQYELIDPWPKKVTWRSAVLTRTGATTAAYDALRRLASTG